MPKILWISCKWNLVDDQDNDDGQSWSWVLHVFRQDIALENNLTIVCISSYLIQTKDVLMLIKGIWHKYDTEINHLMHFRALLWRDDQYLSFRALYQPLQQWMVQPQSRICSVFHWGQYDQPLTVEYIMGVFVWSHGLLRNYVTIRMAGKNNGRKSCALKTWQLVPYFQHFCTFQTVFYTLLLGQL